MHQPMKAESIKKKNDLKVKNRVYRCVLWVCLLGIVHQYLAERAAAQGDGSDGKLTIVSAAYNSKNAPLAAESLATAYGNNLATSTEKAETFYPTVELGGTSVKVGGQSARLLFVSPEQINFQIPSGLPEGKTDIVVRAGDGKVSKGEVRIARYAPGLFSADGSGMNAPSGVALTRRETDVVEQALYREDASKGRIEPATLEPGSINQETTLVLYGTGIRGAESPGKIRVVIGGIYLPVDYAGPDPENPLVDQIIVTLTEEIIGCGCGRVEVLVTIEGGGISNSLSVNIGSRKEVFGPRITRLSTDLVLAGSPLIIYGSGFNPQPQNNKVEIGYKEALVTKATPNALYVNVPFGIENGTVTIKARDGVSLRPSREKNVRIRTSVSGKLQDNDTKQALSGVSVDLVYQEVISGENRQSTVTDQNGVYVFSNVSEGIHLLSIIGNTKGLPYPAIGKPIAAVSNTDYHDGTTSLQRINTTATQISISESEDIQREAGENQVRRSITDKGLILEYDEKTVFTYPENRPDKIGLSLISNSQTPVKLEPNMFSRTVAQITPVKTRLEPGGKLTFPNQDKYLANDVVNLYRLDQNPQSLTLGTFVLQGTARVSGDGNTIQTGQNEIKEASIYLVSNTRPTTTIKGNVVAKVDNINVPVAGARVRSRGQETITDGLGSFMLSGVQAGSEDTISVEALIVRPDGKTSFARRDNIPGNPGSITELSEPLVLSVEAGNNSPRIWLDDKVIRVNPGQTKVVEFICFDPDGNANIQPDLTPQPAWMSLRGDGEGRWFIKIDAPEDESSKKYSIRLTATDQEAVPVVENFVVWVNGKPTAKEFPAVLVTEQNTPIRVGLSGTDPDNDAIIFKIRTNPANGTLNIVDSEMIYTPRKGWTGIETIEYFVSDGYADSNVVQIAINTKENAPPTLLLSKPSNLQVRAGEKVEIRIEAKDVSPSQKLTISYENALPSGATFEVNGNSALFSWTPTGRQTGKQPAITFKVVDDGTPIKEARESIEITVTNAAPKLILPGTQTVVVGQKLEFDVKASDEDTGQIVKLSISGVQPDGVTFNAATGRFSWTPSNNQAGDYRVSFKAEDDGNPIESVTESVLIKVTPTSIANRPPVLTVPTIQTVTAGNQLKFTVTANDPDTDQILVITISSPKPQGVQFIPQGKSGEFIWTPTTQEIGNYKFTFRVVDNGTPALEESKDVQINVLAGNTAPQLSVPETQKAKSGQRLVFNVTGTDADTGQTVILSAQNAPAGAVFTTTGGSGQLSWTPGPGQLGTYTVTFRVTDNGLQPKSTEKNVVIQVFPALRETGFTTASVSDKGITTRYAGRPTQQYEEDLGGGVRLEMVIVPGGSFQMGSPASEAGRQSDEGPQRRVNVEPFAIGKYEVTQAQWQAIMGNNPSVYVGKNLPVDSVKWNDAREFCRRLNERLGLSENNGYRLPSEAEWEYAARANTVTPYTFGTRINAEVVNHKGSISNENVTADFFRALPVEVGSLGVANGWGLFDLHGNVWEWCEDDYHADYVNAPAGSAPWIDADRRTTRVIRGGSWDNNAVDNRSANRHSSVPEVKYGNVGFRLSRFLPIVESLPNRAPTLFVPENVTVRAGQTLRFNVTASDVDVNQKPVISVKTKPTDSTYIASSDTSGEFVWNTTTTQKGSYEAIFEVRDDGTPAGKEEKRVNITVYENNIRPVISVPGQQTIGTGQKLVFKVQASDADTDQQLVITVAGAPITSRLNKIDNTTSSFEWTPTGTETRSYTVKFKVTDSGSPALSDEKEVIINVNNSAPVIKIPSTITVTIGQSVSFTVLASDPDVGQTLTVSATNMPTGSIFDPTTGQFSWVPVTSQVGNYTVSFRVADNGTPSLSQTKTMVITVVVRTPVFKSYNFTTASVSATGVVTRIAGSTRQQYEEDLGGGVKLEMVAIPGGSFQMGSPSNEDGRYSDEGPQRTVSVSQFVMGKYEVTQAQWRAVMGTNPSYFTGDTRPVEKVSWNEAQDFCRRLNERLGLSGANGYRLPTEAEWEYAARAGTTTPFAFGVTINAEIVNYNGGGPYGNAPVGVYREQTVNVGSLGVANGWGLNDMHGNVWEWVEDDYYDSYSGGPTDGRAWVEAPQRATNRVLRGGSWGGDAVLCRSAHRVWYAPGGRAGYVGFRLSRTLP